MNLAIVHLTDLHIRSSNDDVLTHSQAITAAIKPRVMQADLVVIAVTGDLSFSGKESELLEAASLLDEIQSTLAAATSADTYVAIIPGNHDCDFTVTDDDLRQVLLRNIQQEREISPDTLTLLVKPLGKFFEIRDEFFRPTQTYSPLAWTYQIHLAEAAVLVKCFNTAWCSSLREEQGKLFFPSTSLPDESTSDQDLVVAMLHHPTPWMEARNGRLFRDHLEETADLVLTGHDHVPDQRFVTKLTGQRIQYIEGVALQDSESSRTGFNLLTIDISAKRQKLWTFLWDSSDLAYSPRQENPFATDLQVNRARKRNEFVVTDTFQRFIDDLGTQVTHPTAGLLTRPQVFKYPQLRRIRFAARKTTELVGAERLASDPLTHRLLLITGEEDAGKTTLSKQLFEDLLGIDVVPIYLQARRSKRDFRSRSSVDRSIRDAVAAQYGPCSAERYLQLDPDQRAIIIDDYDKAAIPPDLIGTILRHLTALFGRVYLLADAMAQELKRLEVRDLGQVEYRQDTAHYEILPFGFQRRNSMVEQWMSLNPDLATDVGRLVHQTELRNRMLDTVIGKNLVPAFPVYILGVLQASDSGEAVDLRASINAHYYELFIKTALAAGSDGIEYSIKTSFLAFLAYRMLEREEARMTLVECADIYREFKEEYALSITYDAVMSALRRSRLLMEYGDEVEFRYAYCFYYFAASFLTKNLEREMIRRKIEELADGIYEEENANIFLFLAHLSEDSFILDQMLRCARGMFGDLPMATLEEDVAFLGEDAEDLLGPKFWDVGDIRTLRDKLMERRDERQAEEDRPRVGLDRPDDYAATQEHIRKLGSAFKTLQILGQVLKNFPASIRGERKEQIAKAAYGVALRALTDILGFLQRNQGEIVLAFMQRHLEEDDVSGYVEAFQRAKSSVAGLTRLVGFGAVIRIVTSLGGAGEQSPSLSVRAVAEGIGSSVARLTVFGMELDYSGKLPQPGIKRLHRILKDHRVACSILQFLVVRHMHLFDVSYKEREQACAELGIAYKRLQLRAADPRRKLIGPGREKGD